MTTQTRTRTRPLRIGDHVKHYKTDIEGIVWCFAPHPSDVWVWIDGSLHLVAKWNLIVTGEYRAPKRSHLDEWAYAVPDEADEDDPRQITFF